MGERRGRTTGRSRRAGKPACTVRMYRQGFGDCFLLKFPVGTGFRHVMIDCGVVTKARERKEKIRLVLDDVIRETGGTVDVLVVTHEHWDHVSAFADCRDYFEKKEGERQPKLKFNAVWVAWTERPGDALAQEIGELEERGLAALGFAAEQLQKMGMAGSAEEVERLVGFGAFSKQTDKAMDLVHQLGLGQDTLAYLEPGDLLHELGIPGVRVYVLGPPRSEKLMRISNPRKGEAYAEFGAGAFMNAVFAMLGDARRGSVAGGKDFPLDPRLRIPAACDGTLPKDDRTGLKQVVDSYNDADAEWRKVDAEWLRFADSLSLQMNTYTNNTSLVLAFELVGSGKVMLFSADAQVGNWMSWWGFEPGQKADGEDQPRGQALRWRLPPGEKSLLDTDQDGIVGVDDLFRGTVLYKVGHHGSHNGTLGLYGLDRLKRADLVAMMTTNKSDAVKSGWEDIPDPPLYEELLKACRGRVLTSDGNYGASVTLEPPAGAGLPANDPAWTTFKRSVTPGPDAPLLNGPLYYDYTLR